MDTYGGGEGYRSVCQMALPGISVTTLMAIVTLSTAPSLQALVPTAAAGDGLGGLFKSTFASSVEIILPLSAMPAGGIISGMVAGFHAKPPKLWVRAAAGIATVVLVGGLTQLGVRLGAFVASDFNLVALLGGLFVGSLLAHTFAERACRLALRTAWILPLSFGAARALVWVPLALVGYLALVYLVAAALGALVVVIVITVVLVIAYVVLRVMFGRGGVIETVHNVDLVPDPRPAPVRKASIQYNEHGHVTGYTNEHGEHFDKHYHKIGHTNEQGEHFDKYHHKIGSTNEQGEHFDKHDHKTGHTNEQGEHFDNDYRKIGSSSEDKS